MGKNLLYIHAEDGNNLIIETGEEEMELLRGILARAIADNKQGIGRKIYLDFARTLAMAIAISPNIATEIFEFIKMHAPIYREELKLFEERIKNA